VIDERIHAYLTDRAGTIELRPSDPAVAVGRARRRRRIRRAVAASAAVIALGTSAVLVSRPGGRSGDVVSYSASVTESPFDWSVVEPSAGLGLTRGPAALTDDGAVYRLSTAPGPDTGPAGPPAMLWRSDGGADWRPVGLPSDFWASSLEGAGSRLYAVGTAPVDGGSAVRLATSDDGGTVWSTTEVAADVVDLQRNHPDEVVVSPPSIAAHDGTVVVVTSVSAMLDLESRLVDTSAGIVGWETTPDGVVVAEGVCDPAVSGGGRPVTLDCAVGDSGPSSRLVTWDELGVEGELRDLAMNPRHDIYVSQDGGEFVAVDAGTDGTGGTAAQVVATDDGFVLFSSIDETAGGTTTVRRSVDGVTWEPGGDLPGFTVSAGTAGGRAAASVATPDGNQTVHLDQGDGSWLEVDPRTALADPDGIFTGSISFGPLGWAATLGSMDGDLSPQVVHSVDGTSLSVVPLDDLVEVPVGAIVEATVTADVVAVRIGDPPDGDPRTVADQRVIVGTPRD
jgi:hypothetical protein